MGRKLTLSLAFGLALSSVLPVDAGSAEQAAEIFASGKAMLAKADFEGALRAFKAAAQENSSEQEYAQQYAMLRQVIKMRGDCAKERDPEQWLRTSAALRTFYHDNHLYAESLPLDKERHRLQPSAESAVLLAETQLALGQNSEAVELLGGLKEVQTSARTGLLRRLALARMGRIEEAKSPAAQPQQVPDDAGPEYFYDLARLQALTGDSKGALAALTQSFERTAPSKLEAFRVEVIECKDLSSVASTADFAQVLKTPSKVKESDCSKGAGCGKCPKKAKCGAAGPSEGEKKP